MLVLWNWILGACFKMGTLLHLYYIILLLQMISNLNTHYLRGYIYHNNTLKTIITELGQYTHYGIEDLGLKLVFRHFQN